MVDETPLGKRLREVAKGQPAAIATKLCHHADLFDEITEKYYYAKCTAPRMLGIWARARKALRDVTGEDLV